MVAFAPDESGAARPTSPARRTPTTSSTASTRRRSRRARSTRTSTATRTIRARSVPTSRGAATSSASTTTCARPSTGLGVSGDAARAALRFPPDAVATRRRRTRARRRVPSTCTDFGWEIYPQGLREVLTFAGTLGVPIYVTENGIADAADTKRGAVPLRPPLDAAGGDRGRRGRRARLLPLVAHRQLRVVERVLSRSSASTLRPGDGEANPASEREALPRDRPPSRHHVGPPAPLRVLKHASWLQLTT